MAVSAGTAYLDVAPRVARTFSKDLTRQMLRPMAATADRSGQESGRRFGKRFSGGLRAGIGPVRGIMRGFGPQLLAAFGGAAIVASIKSVTEEAREAARVGKITEARLKSTGGVANVTAKQITKLAESLSNKLGIDDEIIQSGENMMLTFKGVRNEAGKNNDIFTQATKAAIDLAAGMHQGQVTAEGLQGANIQLGKALEDPIKGLTALRRVGVSFTQSQRDQIKTLVASGKTLEAQKVILKAVNEQFGGTAAASADAGKRFGVFVGNLKEQVGTALLPVLNRFLGFLVDKLPGAITTAQRVLKPLIQGVQALFGAFADPKVTSDGFVGFMEQIGSAARGLFDVGRKAAARLVVGIQSKLDEYRPKLGEFKESLVAGIKKFGQPILNAITAGVQTGNWKPLGRALGEAVAAALEGAADLAGRVGEWISEQFGRINWFDLGKKAGVAAGAFALSFVPAFLDGIIDAAIAHPMDTAKFVATILPVGKLAGLLLKAFGFLGKIPLLGPLLKALDRSTAPINNAIGRLVGAMARFFLGAFQRAFPTISGRLGRWLTSLILGIAGRYNQMKKAGIRFVGGLLDSIEQQTAFAIRNVYDLIAAIIRPFTRAGFWLVKAGGQVVTGLIRGVEAVGRGLGRVALRVISWLTTPFRPAARWLVARGQQAVGGLISGITSMFGRARTAAGNLVSTIGRVMGRVVGAVAAPFRTARTLINRFLGGIESIGTKIGLSKGWLSFRIPAFQHGGVVGMKQGGGVPGSGRGDKVRALLEPGEVVIPNRREDRRRLLRDPKVRARLGDVGGDPSELVIRMQKGGMASRLTGLVGRVQQFMRSTDPLPYVWGAAGPNAYDCSGLASAILGKLSGRGGGQGQRYFTTSSIGTGVAGLQPGKGTFTIGTTPGTGHMATNLAGLGAEARSTRSGILTGSAARSVTSFARQFYLPQVGGNFVNTGGFSFLDLASKLVKSLLGRLTPSLGGIGGGSLGQLLRAIAGKLFDAGKNHLLGGVFDQGGWLMPGQIGINRTSQPERVLGPAQPVIGPAEARMIGRALGDELERRNLLTVNLDSRRTHQVLAGAGLSNDRRR